MNSLKEYNNFLPIEEFKKLQNLIFHLDFPWRIRQSMTDLDKNIYFTYSFFNHYKVNSDFYEEYIIPILTKLKCVSPMEIRANMFLNKLFDKSGWHTDFNFNNLTAILYLNNCNGGTELQFNGKIKFIKATENKMIVFSSNTKHRVCTSTDVDRRYILNFNYYSYETK
jgi:hypothetical protein